MPQSPAPQFSPAADIPADVVTVILLPPDQAPGPRVAALNAELQGALLQAWAEDPASAPGKCGYFEMTFAQGLARRRVIMGRLSDPASLAALARDGGMLAAHLEARGIAEAAILIEPVAGSPLLSADMLARVALGLRLRCYRFDLRAKSPVAQLDKPWQFWLIGAPKAEMARALARVTAIAEGVEYGRTLVNMPPSHLHPDNIADHLLPLQSTGVDVEVLDADDLCWLGMNALLAVGAGSVRRPKLVVLRYRGKGAEVQPIAFVGKGVCFDSGGLCLKSPEGMFNMHADLGGAAAVAGLMLTLARQESPVHAVAVLGVAENLPSGSAMKPREVITTLSGQTVEVFDTDCEGRLLLADCLAYAASRFDPALIVDLATLTYSVMQALAPVFAGLFSTDDDLAQGMIAAGETVGERFWRLPLDRAYDEGLQSPVADLRHHAKAMNDGDAPYAAAFLRHFTEGRPWVHLDIAGREFSAEDQPSGRQGGTAFGLQMLEEWLHRQSF